MTALPSDATPEEGRERAFGLLLFDAEESLARGEAEKAMLLASRAVKERPDSLTARALAERARRELTRGRRREKLEAKIAEAVRLLASGDFAAAEKIVTSALKFVPDHAVALQLFGRLKERPRATAAETEADRELDLLARAQAEKALDAARSARAAGWDRRALILLRRGLRQAPDHAELLALLRETQSAVEALDSERGRRRTLHQQVRAGLELLGRGDLEGGLRILRAVLEEDPDNARAQAAVQEARRAFLARKTGGVATAPEPAAKLAATVPIETPLPVPAPAAPLAAVRADRLRFRSEPRPAVDDVADRFLPFVPVEILLPRTRRHRTPTGFILIGAALLLGAVLFLSGRGGSTPRPAMPEVTEAAASVAPATPPAPRTSGAPAGPLASVDPELSQAIEATLAAYARALESGQALALAAARPDLSGEARAQRLAPFIGALNATTDVRVLDLQVEGNVARVSILSTDVIIGSPVAPQDPVEETLRFVRRPAGWTLEAAARPR
jgi:tetratricopeptide (TPR) repeat protein